MTLLLQSSCRASPENFRVVGRGEVTDVARSDLAQHHLVGTNLHDDIEDPILSGTDATSL